MKNRGKLMRIAAAIITLIIVAAGASGADTLKVKVKDGVGNYLADPQGVTLYHFKKDAQDKNSCAGPCLEKWPLYYSEQIVAPAGSDSGDFGSFIRSDGARQSTFKGWPLYYFAGDKKPGDTNGQGVKDAWYVINPITIEPCL